MKKKKKSFPFIIVLGVYSSFELKSSIPIGAKVEIGPPRAFLHYESRAKVQLKSSIPIGAKVEISLQGLYTTSSKIYWYPDINILAFMSNFGGGKQQAKNAQIWPPSEKIVLEEGYLPPPNLHCTVLLRFPSSHALKQLKPV